MSLNPSTELSLRRLFFEGFSARDIAEPLRSFDDDTDSAELAEFMTDHGFLVVGVRRKGWIEGFVDVAHLTSGSCGQHCLPFADDQVVSDSTNLAAVIAGLNIHARLFVSMLGHVQGIVTRTDMQKPPFRMWLFGMVTLIEMRLTHLIEDNFNGDEWKPYLSDARVQKAETLLAERRRRNQELNLLSCLQFSDKGQIVARNRDILATTHFESRRRFEEVVKRLERLRNNLAHSQDIIATDWDTIFVLSENLDQILAGPPSEPSSSGETAS